MRSKAPDFSVPHLDGEKTGDIHNGEIKCLDIVEQIIDENEVHGIESWRHKNKCNDSKRPHEEIDKNTFVSNINVEKTHNDEVNVLNFPEHDSPQVVVDTPVTCDCNCYEYVSNFQKMLNNQINKQLKQIRQQCKQKSILDDIIDFQLLTQSVKERPVLWNKFLYIYKDKIGQTVAWQDLCRILKEDFEEMAREDPELLDQPQSTATDITLLRDDEWTCPNIGDPALDENSCDLLESTSVCLSTDELIPLAKFEYDDLTNSRSNSTFENVIGEKESSSTRFHLLPSDDEENPRKILSESENNCCTDRIYKKKLRDRNYCYYCEVPVLNFARHMVKNHKNEEEVQRIISKPKKSKHRKDLLTRLRKKGNYLKSSGQSKPMKTSPLGAATLYVPCPYCLGFYSSKQIYRHKRKCEEKPTTPKADIKSEDPSFAESTRVHADLQGKVFPRMRSDRITVVAQMDHVICEYGARYFRLHRKPHYVHVTSRKMRELSRLLMEIMKMESSVTTMMDVLQPKYYDTIIRATKKISRYDSENKCFKAPTIVMNLSTSLKQCCDIAVEYATENFTTEVALESITGIKILASIIEENWRYDLFGEASGSLNVKEKSLELKTSDEVCSNLEGQTAPCNNEPYSDERIIETRDSKDENFVGVISTEGTAQNNENNECANEAEQSKKKKIIQRTVWTTEQKKLVQSYFKLHIQSKKPPKKRECDALIAENKELLRNKDWLKIKVFIQNVYTKKYKK